MVEPIDAAAADAVPLLYCESAFEIQRNFGLESSSSLCSGWHAHRIAHTRTNTAVAPFVAVSRKQVIEVRPLLPVPWVVQRHN